jgi:N-acetylglucosaminyldiphosphoundecaprenol N-acetyl-beta-D-mannosaminyltransferase
MPCKAHARRAIAGRQPYRQPDTPSKTMACIGAKLPLAPPSRCTHRGISQRLTQPAENSDGSRSRRACGRFQRAATPIPLLRKAWILIKSVTGSFGCIFVSYCKQCALSFSPKPLTDAALQFIAVLIRVLSMSAKELQHPHANVLGVQISAIDMAGAVALADRLIRSGERGYVCVTGVHGVMESQSDTDLFGILNRAFMNTPDGMPMTWVGRLQGHRNMRRVYGPDFMLEMCRLSATRGYRHFLYGGKQGVAQLLSERLSERFPGLQVVGTYTPPFRPLSEQEEQELLKLLNDSKPDILWVGLSTPKQEKFMARHSDAFKVPLMVGVGAAFDIHTGRIQDAPNWMKQSGLQWLHRLCQEPKRLARRYLVNNPMFLFLITLQLLGVKTSRTR